MNFFRSIKIRVWALFEIVVITMLTFTYIFLIAMFPNFYEWMKTYEISEALVEIRSNWYNDGIAEIINNQAAEKKMYIEIYFPQNGASFSVDRINAGLPLGSLTKNLGYEVAKSEKGIVYKRLRDERLDNTALMMGSYIGKDQHNQIGRAHV